MNPIQSVQSLYFRQSCGQVHKIYAFMGDIFGCSPSMSVRNDAFYRIQWNDSNGVDPYMTILKYSEKSIL